MRSVALCWELGGGYGHLSVLRPLARLFLDQGFQVYLIARDLCSAGAFFQETGVTLLQAPFRHGPSLQFKITPTFAHILHNVGYGDPVALGALTAGWRPLFQMIRPELIITEHSPTALLAARCLGIPSVVCGPGFFCPPDETPLPVLLPWVNADPRESAAVENRVLDHVNSVLAHSQIPALGRVTELYHRQTTKLLLTFAELDHFSHRRGETYWGCWPFQPGRPAEWPNGDGKRIIAYLKHFPRLPELLTLLGRLGLPSLVFISGLDPGLRKQFESTTLRFSGSMIDLQTIDGGQCVGITNGTSGTITALLLKGVPLLSIPTYVEQMLGAKAVERLGAGVTVSPTSAESYQNALTSLVKDAGFRQSAERFAEKYRGFDPDQQVQQIFAELAKLIATD